MGANVLSFVARIHCACDVIVAIERRARLTTRLRIAQFVTVAE